MNPKQRLTLRRLIAVGVVALVVLVLCVVAVGMLLHAEFAALAQGGDSTISTLFQMAWARQPWVFFILQAVGFLASHVVAAPFWYLMGHWTAQNASVYDEIRKYLDARRKP